MSAFAVSVPPERSLVNSRGRDKRKTLVIFVILAITGFYGAIRLFEDTFMAHPKEQKRQLGEEPGAPNQSHIDVKLFNAAYETWGRTLFEVRADKTPSTDRTTLLKLRLWEGGLLERAMSANIAPGLESREFDELVVVPGHGVFRGSNFEKYGNPNEWALESHFTTDSRHVEHMISHITMAMRLASASQATMIVFSGGQTRQDAVGRSEAASYLNIVTSNPSDFGLQSNFSFLFAEEFARDSYENLAFSLCRFFEVARRWPKKITVVGFAHKEKRFRDFHRFALRWPLSRFHYLGLSSPLPQVTERFRKKQWYQAPHDLQSQVLSDAATLRNAEADLYLCQRHGHVRMDRNPFRRSVPYYTSVPSTVAGLLLHCDPSLYTVPLPWD